MRRIKCIQLRWSRWYASLGVHLLPSCCFLDAKERAARDCHSHATTRTVLLTDFLWALPSRFTVIYDETTEPYLHCFYYISGAWSAERLMPCTQSGFYEGSSVGMCRAPMHCSLCGLGMYTAMRSRGRPFSCPPQPDATPATHHRLERGPGGGLQGTCCSRCWLRPTRPTSCNRRDGRSECRYFRTGATGWREPRHRVGIEWET